MSPTRSLLAAGGLTGLVIVAVLAVGARQGAFRLSSPDEVVLTADGAVAAQDAPSSVDPVERSRWDDEEDEDDDDDHDDDNRRSSRLASAESRSGSRASDRARHDDD